MNKKIKVHLSAGIVGLVASVIFYIAIGIMIRWELINANSLVDGTVKDIKDLKEMSSLYFIIFLVIVFTALRITLLVLGILQITRSSRLMNDGKGLGIAAGILNIIGLTTIAAIISLIAYGKSDNFTYNQDEDYHDAYEK